MSRKSRRGKYSTVSLPTSLVKEVESVVKSLEYWPTKTDFIREAVLEKLRKFESKTNSKED